jgi:ATP-dependent Clp protease ATP-binding subunit ClpA
MITISSNSMDELNAVYRKLKHQYKATDSIKLDPDDVLYKLTLEKKELNPMIKNLADKALDLCDELEELKSISLPTFEHFVAHHAEQYVFLRQLQEAMETLDHATRSNLVEYIATELELEVEEGEEVKLS